MQQFDITVPATGTFPVHAAGRYIKYVSGNNGGGDCSLIVVPGAGVGGKVVLQPGQAYRIAQDKATPDSWVLQNATGGATILGKVVIGDGRIDDNSLTGTVQVIDGGKSRTLANTAFSMYASAPAVAGQYARVQLWNPANSGKRLVVETITPLSGSTAESLATMFNTVALATLVGAGISKRSSGAASNSGFVYLDSTALAPTPASGDQICFQMPANANQQYSLKEPIVLDPGYGLVMWSFVANDALGCTFEWYEEPNV